MSKPLLPVSTSTPPSSYFTPSESRWGVRSVVLLVGVGALGLILYAIFRRSRPEPEPKLNYPPSFFTWDPPFKKDVQHSSGFLHRTKPCHNERKQINFESYAEGFFIFNLSSLFPSLVINELANVTVTCLKDETTFFVHRVAIKNLQTPVQFFMPNLPYQDEMKLKIEILEKSHTVQAISQSIDMLRGVYRFNKPEHFRGCEPTILPLQTKTTSYALPHSMAIDSSTLFLMLMKENGRIDIAETAWDSYVIRSAIQNQQLPILAYLKIVERDYATKEDFSIALPFFSQDGEIKFSHSELVERWRNAYYQTTKKEAKPELKLFLVAVKLTIYEVPSLRVHSDKDS